MFSLDSNPEHDRTFAEVAPLLAEWQTLHEPRPSAIERAWQACGFAIDYGAHVARHHLYCFATADHLLALALLPAWVEAADPTYRAAILHDLLAYCDEHADLYPLAACAGLVRAALAVARHGGDVTRAA